MISKTKPRVRVVEGIKIDGTPVLDECFELVYDYSSNRYGGFITVRDNGRKARIRLDNPEKYEIIKGGTSVNDVVNFKTPEASPLSVVKPQETDEAAMDRIQERFNILDEMSAACIRGDIRAMIVSGPPGVGKSFGVEQQLEAASLFDRLSSKKVRYEIVKGALTPLGLYSVLYKYSDAKNVLVFDDADGVFADELSLNILKAALDSGKRRRICWNSDSSMLRREGIPDSFDFKGSVIFITNLSLESVRSKKLQDHIAALHSRCHFVDLTINSERDKLLRIKQVHRDASNNQVGGMFASYDFPENTDVEILDFMFENRTSLRELSLRMALKIADLVKVNPEKWKQLARTTCMHNS